MDTVGVVKGTAVMVMVVVVVVVGWLWWCHLWTHYVHSVISGGETESSSVSYSSLGALFVGKESVWNAKLNAWKHLFFLFLSFFLPVSPAEDRRKRSLEHGSFTGLDKDGLG